MTFEITERDFLNIVNRDHCLGKEVPNGTAKEGHPNCESCKGNYFVGGECNRGGCHLMSKDLKVINQNFKQFESLVSRQIELSNSKNEKDFDRKKERLITKFQELEKKCDEERESFFYGSCIILDGTQNLFSQKIKLTFRRLARELKFYADKVKNTTWEQLKSFNTKIVELEKMQSEITRLAKEWKEETDPARKKQLFALLQEQRKKARFFEAEIKKDPTYDLFSEEQNIQLGKIVENIFRGEENFLRWQKEEDEEEKRREQEKYLGFIPKRWGRGILWGGIIIAIMLIFYFFYRWIKKSL
jgi:hypothetical protein